MVYRLKGLGGLWASNGKDYVGFRERRIRDLEGNGGLSVKKGNDSYV